MNGSPLRANLALALQLATLAVVVLLAVDLRRQAADAEDADEETDIEEIRDELIAARVGIEEQVRRLRADADRLERVALAGGSAAAAGERAPADLTTGELLERLQETWDLYTRFELDPIQRLPVERQRNELEAELRGRGDEAVLAISDRLPRWVDSRLQSRVLLQVVEPIGGEEAHRLAAAVMNDRSLVAGVRLLGAKLAMARDPDGVIEKLVHLLESPDPSFNRRDDIAIFFQENPDPRAEPALLALCQDPATDRLLRRFVLQALSSYSSPQVIEALKEVCTSGVHGELRAEALQSLNKILGRDVLDFCRFLRERLTPEDPLRTLVSNIEAQWAAGE